jgi:hypothetical protein
MLTPKEQKIVATIRREAAVTGEYDARKKTELRREQRTLLAVIDRLTGTEALQACQILVKWHRAVFDGGEQALRLDNGYPVDRTDVDEAARLAYLALGGPARGPRHPMPYALDEAQYITPEMHAAAPTADDILCALLCDDCPPVDYCTDKTRCRECPRRRANTGVAP